MTTEQTFLIVGAGLAGAKAAQTLRHEGFDGRLVLVGAERERPYQRPPLSKDYLRGEAGRERVYVHDVTFYARPRHAFWLSGDRVRAGTNVNLWDMVDPSRRLNRDHVPVAERRLADPGMPLEQLVPLESA